MSASELEDLQRQSGLVGEDAAVFSFEEQSLKSWGAFLAVLGTVLTALYYLWLNPDTGYGESESLSPTSQRYTRQPSFSVWPLYNRTFVTSLQCNSRHPYCVSRLCGVVNAKCGNNSNTNNAVGRRKYRIEGVGSMLLIPSPLMCFFS